uniref:Uncharacterized protein n=1 Tax=Opuntia streptacantha TaxID=393608 RepID=A0A7C9EQK0_OPUST
MVEASTSNAYPWFTIPSSTATAEAAATASDEPIFSVAAKCECAIKSPAVIPAGSTAAFYGKSSVTTAIVTASAAATPTDTSTAATLAATTSYESAAIAKDAGTIRSKVYEFDGITTCCYCFWNNYSRRKFKPGNRSKQPTAWEKKDSRFGLAGGCPREVGSCC